jgi:hypothetical protein
LANIVLNTVAKAERSRVEREVLDTLSLHPSSALWDVAILALDGRSGFLVSVESGEQVVAAWTFDRTEHVRSRVLAEFGPPEATDLVPGL